MSLQRAGVNTLYELMCLDDIKLLSIRGIGEQALKEISELKSFAKSKSKDELLKEKSCENPSLVRDGTILEYIAGKRGKYVYSIVDDKKHVKDDIPFPDTLSKVAQRIIKANGISGVRQVAEMKCSDFFVIKKLGEQTGAEIIEYIRAHVVIHSGKKSKNDEYEKVISDLFDFLDITSSKATEYIRENAYLKLENRLEEKGRKKAQLDDIIYLATTDPLYSLLSKKVIAAVKKKNGVSINNLQDSFFRLLNIPGLFDSLLEKLSEDKKIRISDSNVSLYVMTFDEWADTLPERQQRIMKARKAGKSYNDIALEEGLSRQRVGQLVTSILQKKPVTSD